DDNEIIRKKSKTVTEFNQKLWDLLDDMAQTMYAADGVGLAAVQVGILKRAVVINTGDQLYELINPMLIHSEGVQNGSEGCLSSPDEYGMVARPMKVTVTAKDRYGKSYELTGEELLARALCHEIDHLEGILFKDLATEMLDIERP
ncbi:MAG: peptide deformylase, partial [Oscillospiraceae bacterium]